MSKIRHSVEVKGRGHTWSVPTYITEQTAQDWRDDGLTVHAIENTIPYWLPLWIPTRLWCAVQDFFNFKWLR